MFEGGCIEKLQEFVPRGPRLGNTDVEDISLLIRVTSPSDYYCADGLRGLAKKKVTFLCPGCCGCGLLCFLPTKIKRSCGVWPHCRGPSLGCSQLVLGVLLPCGFLRIYPNMGCFLLGYPGSLF